MDSLKAFHDAKELCQVAPTEVLRLNGANSVWLVVRNEEPVAVMKYFESGLHSHSHFEIELEFLKINSKKTFLPEVLIEDSHRKLLVLEYFKNTEDSRVDLSDLVALIREEIPSLRLPKSAHNGPVGILSWWEDGLKNFGTGERIVLEIARSQQDFRDAIEHLKSSWSPDVLIHGDLKLQNLMLGADSPLVIDWESVGLGVRGWDEAGLLQSVLVEAALEKNMASWAKQNIPILIDHVETASPQIKDALVARLIQTAIEYAQSSEAVPSDSVDVLQIAKYVCENNWHFLEEMSNGSR